ncbi:MAG: cren protein [Thermoprotei archaeon]|nr:MAG: cren protein [Thermoprotei archaeon]RLF02846.1 MAG: cren protein [Thermoprotei archaeon]
MIKIESERCINVRLSNIESLARFIASLFASGHPVYILHFKTSLGKHVYGFLAVLKDFYKYYGLPLFYYVILEKPLQGSFILVKLGDERMEIRFSEGVKPGWIYAPIVSLSEPPAFINVGGVGDDRA